jgi:large subunit ribosomal protein L9
MEVILRASVDNLGHPGDIVKVSPGYGRNYLVPRGLAYPATPGNKKRIQQEHQRLETAEAGRRAVAEQLAAKLEQASAVSRR